MMQGRVQKRIEGIEGTMCFSDIHTEGLGMSLWSQIFEDLHVLGVPYASPCSVSWLVKGFVMGLSTSIH